MNTKYFFHHELEIENCLFKTVYLDLEVELFTLHRNGEKFQKR